MTQTLGEFVKESRQAKGLSLRGLAKQTGLNYSHISKIENGHRIPLNERYYKAWLVVD